MTRALLLTRRRFFGLIAVTATGGAFFSAAEVRRMRPAFAASDRLITGAGMCSIMPETTEGPFYTDPRLVRDDITEGKEGMPLRLRLQVVDRACNPLPGARVDVWHCDAEGVYSGYPRQLGGVDSTGQTFLRGTLMADADGVATFRTIFPGWYPGRTPHIHFKAFPGERRVLTGQLFFPDDLSQEIYATVPPYSARGHDGATFNEADGIARRAGPAALAELARDEDALEAALVIAVAAG